MTVSQTRQEHVIAGHSDDRFLNEMADAAAAELARHQEQRRSWSYHDVLTRDVLADLASRAPIDVDPAVAAAFVGNLLVEKGHAEYDRISGEMFERQPVFRAWKNRWVAEEEPHGSAMLEWGKVRGIFDPNLVHAGIQAFLSNGLTLSFSSAPYGLAYASVQERATRVTHLAVKRGLPTEESEGRRVLSNIIADEERHERFYSNMTLAALTSGDHAIVDAQMVEITRVALAFEMPGIERDIPDGERYLAAYRDSGAFSFRGLAHDVILPIMGKGTPWGDAILAATLTDPIAEQCRDTLLGFLDQFTDLERERQYLLRFMKARKQMSTMLEAA